MRKGRKFGNMADSNDVTVAFENEKHDGSDPDVTVVFDNADDKVKWPTALGGIILAIVCLVAAQLAASIFEMLLSYLIPDYVANIIATGIYILLTFLFLYLFIQKTLNVPLSSLRFKKFKLNLPCVIIAILMPLLVSGTFILLVQGDWVESTASTHEKIYFVISGIFFTSIGAGIVEEMVFRGVIMGLLEKWSNTKAAILVPSILFGAVHIMNDSISLMSAVILVIAGTAVGVLFSLVCLHYDSFWNNALIHILWNISTGGIYYIGTKADEYSIYSYVLKTKSMILTGGDFGIEASIISVSAYCLFIIVMLVIMKKAKNSKTKKES